MNENEISALKLKAIEWLMTYTPKLLLALLVIVIGFWVARKLGRLFELILKKNDMQKSVRKFLSSLAVVTLKILIVVSAMSILGIPMTAIITSLGAAGLAIALALQGTLQNFAGGIIILTLKPFKDGDFIEAEGQTGHVEEIKLFSTVLLTLDNKTVIIPNGKLASGVIVNFTMEELCRLDVPVGIAYGEDIDRARRVLSKAVESHKAILSEPFPPFIGIGALANSAVELTVRVWVKKEEYWNVNFYINEIAYTELHKEGITIPFPQMDIHIKQEEKVLN